MSLEVSDAVRSLCGKDKGRVFFVIGLDDRFALVCDGRGRKLQNPKRKNIRHLSLVRRDSGAVAEKIRQGARVTDSEIRRALADISKAPEEQGGMHVG